MDQVVKKFEDTIKTACDKSFKKRTTLQKTVGGRSVPWWSDTLTVMRKRINALRRRYQRTRNDNVLRECRKMYYFEEKKKYQSSIRREKIHSWKQYCNLTTSVNPWNAVYRLAAGKMRKCSTLTTLQKPDGSFTTDLEGTMNCMLDYFIPVDDGIMDNEYHRHIRNQIKDPISVQDDREFSQEEVLRVLENMNPQKCPGEDGITSGILLRVFMQFPRFVTAIYNECLRRGVFPKLWKRAKIVPIVKPGRENSTEVSKFHPISLLKVGAKVLENYL